MTQPGVVTPYTTASPLFGQPQSWMPPAEQERLLSYQSYEDLYWNRSQTLKLMMRGGADDDIIYVPNPMITVETLNRYIGANVSLRIDEVSGTPQSRADALNAFTALFKRERFYSRYYGNKRFGLIRGDMVWHVIADPTKPAGSRLSILAVDPGAYFPIEDPEDPEKILGCHLVDQIQEGDDTFIKRQTYRREQDANGNFTGRITTESAVFKPDEWFDPTKAPQRIIVQPTYLDARITSLPVYHVPMFFEPGNRWGSSVLRGHERLMSAIDGSFTDEDITLALEGLGVYYTENNHRPVDPATGEVTDWNIYPGKVVQGTKLERVQGVGSVAPYGEHIQRMMEALRDATGTGDAAIGKVDVGVAESGVALALRLAPTLALASERDQIIADVHNQMLWDLRSWLLVYEAINVMDVVVTLAFGDKLPANKRAAVELVTMLMSTSPPILSAGSARRYLATQGLSDVFADNEGDLVAEEQKAVTEWTTAEADARAAAELAGGDGIGAQNDQGGSEG